MYNPHHIAKLFIVSCGRTGTEFFGENLGKLSPQFLSVHEPDAFTTANSVKNTLSKKVSRIGVLNLVILKALGLRGTRNLSLKRINGKISAGQALKLVMEARKGMLQQPMQLYCEANAQLFGLVPDLATLPNARVVVVFRDPRTWVRSWMRHGGWYDETDMMERINLLGFKRLTPANIGQANSAWKRYSTFEKLCWAWNAYNSLFYNAAKAGAGNIKCFRFEDVFEQKKPAVLHELMQFALFDFYNAGHEATMREMLNARLNASADKGFPAWQQWTSGQCGILHKHCGALMEQLNYGVEEEWMQKIK